MTEFYRTHLREMDRARIMLRAQKRRVAGPLAVSEIIANFFLPLHSSLDIGTISGVVRGTGTYDFSNTTADGARSVTDFEGIVHTDIQTEEARFQGVRRVRNLLTDPEFIVHDTGTTWGVYGSDPTREWLTDPDGTPFLRLTNTSGATQGILQASIDASEIKEGDKYILSMEIRNVVGVSPAATIKVNMRVDTTDTYPHTDIITSTSTTEWKRFSFAASAAPASPTNFQIRIYGDGAIGDSFDVRKVMVEKVTGQTVGEAGIPSEYVSADMGVGTELITRQPEAADWTQLGTNGLEDDAGAVKITYVDNSFGAEIDLDAYSGFNGPFKNGATYQVSADVKVNTGAVRCLFDPGSGSYTLGGYSGHNVANTTFIKHFTYQAVINGPTSTRLFFDGMGAGESIWIKNISVKLVDHGANVSGVKYFDYHNIIPLPVSNVVTPAAAGTKFGRRVENLATDTDLPSLTDANWGSTGGGAMTDGVIIASALNSGVTHNFAGFTAISGRTYALSFEATLNSGADDWKTGQLGTASLTGSTFSFTVTGTTQRFGVVLPCTSSGTVNLRFVRASAAASNITLDKVQFEDITDTEDLTTSSEYVSVGTGSFPFSGTGLDGIAEFATSNPNRISSSIVLSDQTTYPRTPGDGVLIEGQRTNDFLHSNDFSNAAWVKTNITVGTDSIQLPDGTTGTAERLTAGAANATMLQTITKASATNIVAFYLKRKTGTGNIELTSDNGTTWTAVTINDQEWTRVHSTANAMLNPVGGIRIVTSGDVVYAASSQLEEGSFPSSYIPTVGSAVTRNVDNLTYDPANYVEEGTIIAGFMIPYATAGNQAILSFDDANVASYGFLDQVNINMRMDTHLIDNGGTKYEENSDNGDVVAGDACKVATRYTLAAGAGAGGDRTTYLDGVRSDKSLPVAIDLLAATSPASIDRFCIGHSRSGGDAIIRELFGTVKDVEIYDVGLTDAKFVEKTS